MESILFNEKLIIINKNDSNNNNYYSKLFCKAYKSFHNVECALLSNLNLICLVLYLNFQTF